jgi:hypothetical protein
MNLKQHIKQILKEEISSELKKPFMRYEKLINKLVYDVFDEGICGFSWDVIKLHMREGISIRIILHFTEDSFRDFDYERMVNFYGQSKQELKVLIEDFLPKFDGIYIAYDTTKCGEDLNESKTLQENEEDPTQKILNFLLRRYEIEEHIFGDEDRPIIIKMLRIKNSYGQSYSIRSTGSKKEQIRDILDTLMILNVIDDFDFSKTKDNPYAQKAVKAVKMFYDKVMGNKSNINESKTSQHLKLMNNLLDPFKEKDCLCDIRISFDIEDNYHNIYLVFSQEELHEKFFNLVGMRTYISKMMNEVKMELESFLPIRNVFIGYYTKPNCEWSPLNESENKEGKYISDLEDLTEEFKKEDCVCDIKIEYKPEEEIYLINVILGNLDMDDKFNGVNWRERDYRGKLKTKIRKEVFDYLPIPFFVEFKSTPRCKDYKNLQESEDKKSRFLSTIEEDGLFQVMQDTGLSLKQIKSKIGELPREVFERYIKDFLGKDEIGWDLSIQISPNKIIDSFYISDGVVTIEVNEVDSIGRVVAGSFERLSVLSDEEIFSLVNEMSQINDDYLDYM